MFLLDDYLYHFSLKIDFRPIYASGTGICHIADAWTTLSTVWLSVLRASLKIHRPRICRLFAILGPCFCVDDYLYHFGVKIDSWPLYASGMGICHAVDTDTICKSVFLFVSRLIRGRSSSKWRYDRPVPLMIVENEKCKSVIKHNKTQYFHVWAILSKYIANYYVLNKLKNESEGRPNGWDLSFLAPASWYHVRDFRPFSLDLFKVFLWWLVRFSLFAQPERRRWWCINSY